MTNPDERDRVRDRMDGDYEPPVLAEPDADRPVPAWDPPEDDEPA
ncbi:hypothetical protein ACH4T9_31220 [Micromonospora sp. NPDC020750]